MHIVASLAPFVYIMCAKLKEDDLQHPLLHYVDTSVEKTHSPIGEDTWKPLELEGETWLLKTDHDKDHPLPELQILQQPHKKE